MVTSFNKTCPWCNGSMSEHNSFCCIKCHNSYFEKLANDKVKQQEEEDRKELERGF